MEKGVGTRGYAGRLAVGAQYRRGSMAESAIRRYGRNHCLYVISIVCSVLLEGSYYHAVSGELL